MTMHEELMEEFGLPPESIDTADIYKDGRLLASFKPKGLWIIGANGRIDLLTSKGSYILVDGAEQFQPPKWLIYSPEDKRNGKPFDKSSLLKILQ